MIKGKNINLLEQSFLVNAKNLILKSVDKNLIKECCV